jgi:hypothetical protein
MTTRIYHLAEAYLAARCKERSAQERKECREFFDAATNEEQKEAQEWAKFFEEEHEAELEFETRAS